MSSLRFLPVLFLALSAVFSGAFAQDITLQPKYGAVPKTDAQLAADSRFLASVDERYKGDRKRAAGELALRGWESFRKGQPQDAMRRFNQAWLLDSMNGHALWGMAAIQAELGRLDDSVKLFAEAERLVAGDVDFAADHARTLGFAAAQASNEALLRDAFARFARVHDRAPQHTLNLQNWAITLFYVGRYEEAWKKVKLAEATSGRSELDQGFIAELQARMPRP